MIFCFGKLNAQPNADREYVKSNKIRTALIMEKNSCGGVMLSYDQEGRLERMIYFNWPARAFMNGPFTGTCDVAQYDLLGRTVCWLSYTITDSTHLFNPGEADELNSSTYYEYSGDTVIIETDTSWDYNHRLYEVRKKQTTVHYGALPPPREMRPVYYGDRIASSKLTLWSRTTYVYPDESSLSPNQSIESGGCSMLRGAYDGNRISYYMLSDSYEGDSTTRCEIESWYTLNGERDTSYSIYKRSISHNNNPAVRREFAPLVTYGYVISKKRFGKYHVRYHLAYPNEWLKLTSKTPWLEYQFALYPVGVIWDAQDNFTETIETQSEAYRTKPVFTYWP